MSALVAFYTAGNIKQCKTISLEVALPSIDP